jgi:hypothetical protein
MVPTAGVVDPDPTQTDRLEDSYQRLRAELQHRGYLPAAVPDKENR